MPVPAIWVPFRLRGCSRQFPMFGCLAWIDSRSVDSSTSALANYAIENPIAFVGHRAKLHVPRIFSPPIADCDGENGLRQRRRIDPTSDTAPRAAQTVRKWGMAGGAKNLQRIVSRVARGRPSQTARVKSAGRRRRMRRKAPSKDDSAPAPTREEDAPPPLAAAFAWTCGPCHVHRRPRHARFALHECGFRISHSHHGSVADALTSRVLASASTGRVESSAPSVDASTSSESPASPLSDIAPSVTGAAGDQHDGSW